MKGALAGVSISAFAGAVSYFLSMGLILPPGGEAFKFLATFGAISGVGVGSVFSARAKTYPLPGLLFASLVNLFCGAGAAFLYVLRFGRGELAGPEAFGALSLLLLIAFFCLGFALPLAGLSFDRSTQDGTTRT